MIIRTNYGTGPYRISTIKRACTCNPCCLHDAPPSEAHMHLVLDWAGPHDDSRNPGEFYLGWYSEENLRSITHPNDAIEVMEAEDAVQMTLL